MNILNLFRKSVSPVAGTTMQVMSLPPVQWSTISALTYLSEGFQRCAPVNACITAIMDAIAALPIDIEVDGEDVEDHPLEALLAHPNPMMSGTEFIETLVAQYLITGNAYVEVIEAGGAPKEMWLYAPYYTTIERPRAGFIPIAFVYDTGVPDQRRVWPVDGITADCDLLHLKTINPASPWYGLSPMTACAIQVDQFNGGSEWNMRTLQNAGVPSGALMMKGALTEGQMGKLKDDLNEKFMGAANARRPLILGGDMTWQQLSMTPLDMDWSAGQKSAAISICSIYGVPTQLLGIEGSQTYANMEQACLYFHTDTVIPLAERLFHDLGVWLSRYYKQNITICIDYDEVTALAPLRKQKFETVNASTFMTINERREAMDLDTRDDVPGADQLTQPVSLTVLPTASDNEQAVGEVAKTSLTGIQITSMLDILNRVATGILPKDSAIAVMSAAFPSLTDVEIKQIVGPIDEGSAEPVQPAPAPMGAGNPFTRASNGG